MMDDILRIELIQGEDFELDISWEDEEGIPVDITGYTAKMQFRKNAGDPKIYLEASSENNKIFSDTFNNILKLKLPAEELNDLTFTHAEADLFVTSPAGKSFRLFKAHVKLVKRVTTW
ncbi:MAG: hypothetical protein R6W90_07560 [Ignavibacteriaceae bacterium]